LPSVVDTSRVIDERERRRVAVVLVAAIVLIVAYWVAWYADRSLVASNTTSAYYEFENAFPLADGWLALCCVAALLGLRHGSPLALLWLLLAGGAGMYLFCMDALYDLENHIWWSSGAGGLIELFINLLTLGVSAWFLRWTWRRRVALLAGT
jgi:hypothetical protein